MGSGYRTPISASRPRRSTPAGTSTAVASRPVPMGGPGIAISARKRSGRESSGATTSAPICPSRRLDNSSASVSLVKGRRLTPAALGARAVAKSLWAFGFAGTRHFCVVLGQPAGRAGGGLGGGRPVPDCGGISSAGAPQHSGAPDGRRPPSFRRRVRRHQTRCRRCGG
jgi:hypothetical protein